MLVFFYFFISIGIRLKLHTYDNELQALHALEIKNPNVLLNIPEENKKGKKKMSKDLIPGKPDTTKYPHNKTSKECLLRCQQDGEVWKRFCLTSLGCILKTPDKNHHCFYQAVLTSLHQYINDLEVFHKYTTEHLMYQMLIHLIENLPNKELMKQIFDQAWYKIMCLHACPEA